MVGASFGAVNGYLDTPIRELSVVESIRLRPGMYVGEPGPSGIDHLVLELVANAVDQYLAGKATFAQVSLHKNGSITVRDDGAGMPFDERARSGVSLAEHWMTNHHNSPTADDHLPHVHLNPYGIGLVSVCALSSHLKVVSHRSGRRWTQSFSRGKAVELPVATASAGRGTQITFVPDKDIFGDARPCREKLRRTLFENAHLIPGLEVRLDRERFHALGGLSDYVRLLAEDRLGEPKPRFLYVSKEAQGVRVEAVAMESAKDCRWHSWCNGLATLLHGSHVDGFKDALRHVKWKPRLAAIHVLLTSPHFKGRTRNQLGNPEVRSIVRQIVKAALKEGNP